ncbi:MAG: prepilin-type N-terminal cleavage/methylation domain-containing protein [Tahibacter sp.]
MNFYNKSHCKRREVASPGVRARLQRRTFANRQSGFSLIELVAAFVIFALGFGVLMQILTASLRNASVSGDYTQAALWAQSKLDVEGVGERLKEGHSVGKFDDGYRWELDINRYKSPDAPPDLQGGEQIELYRLDLNVVWGGRNSRNAHFVTLRSMLPDANAAPGANPAAAAAQASGQRQNTSRGGASVESKE